MLRIARVKLFGKWREILVFVLESSFTLSFVPFFLIMKTLPPPSTTLSNIAEMNAKLKPYIHIHPSISFLSSSLFLISIILPHLSKHANFFEDTAISKYPIHFQDIVNSRMPKQKEHEVSREERLFS